MEHLAVESFNQANLKTMFYQRLHHHWVKYSGPGVQQHQGQEQSIPGQPSSTICSLLRVPDTRGDKSRPATWTVKICPEDATAGLNNCRPALTAHTGARLPQQTLTVWCRAQSGGINSHSAFLQKQMCRKCHSEHRIKPCRIMQTRSSDQTKSKYICYQVKQSFYIFYKKGKSFKKTNSYYTPQFCGLQWQKPLLF